MVRGKPVILFISLPLDLLVKLGSMTLLSIFLSVQRHSKVQHYVDRIKQDLHRLEKYLNLEGFLEKSLKIKSALKSTGKSLKALKSP